MNGQQNVVYTHNGISFTHCYMNFENIMLSKIIQTQPYTIGFNLYKISRIGKSIKTESRLVVSKD